MGGKNKGTWHPGENLSCVGGGVAPDRANLQTEAPLPREGPEVWQKRKSLPSPQLAPEHEGTA